MIKDLNVRPKTTKLLEENIKNKILDIDLGYDVLGLIPKAKVSKARRGAINRNSFLTH